MEHATDVTKSSASVQNANYFQVYDSPKEELKRMEIFINNVKYIEEFNSHKNRTMTLGLNKFADMVRAAFFRHK